MRHLAMVVVASGIVLAGCDQDSPTGPDDLRPQFQSNATTVSISGKGTAGLYLFNQQVETYASFQCPEGERATVVVQLSQAHSDGSVTDGLGSVEEDCRGGPNTVVVTVSCYTFPNCWDVARATGFWQLITPSGSATDTKDVSIKPL
jgi:hypothetical protein